MDEEIKEQEQVDTATTNENETHEQEQTKAVGNVASVETPKTFTQDQVNDFVRQRIERDRNSFFRRYGVSNRNELDDLMGKAQSYDVMFERYNNIKTEKADLIRELAFLENNVSPDKKEDVMAYFNGKGMEFNRDAMKQEIATHPEWLKVVEKSSNPMTTITKLSADRGTTTGTSERSEVAKMFGLNKIL